MRSLIAIRRFFSIILIINILKLDVLLTNQSSLKCVPCSKMKCMERKLNCKGGIVKGICGCCDKCAKVLDENCGGIYNYLGKCDKDLFCKPLIKSNRRRPRPAKGRCVRKINSERRLSDEPRQDFQQCRPKCSPEFCKKRPRAICSATG